MINPFFMGGPRWPSMRQSWRRVRRGGHTVILSDALSDPFYDEPEANIGFGVEVLVETSDPIAEPVQESWAFTLAYNVAQQAADSGAFRNLRDELDLFSMELDATYHFDPARTAGGRIGILFGLAPPDYDIEWQLPTGLVRVITAKLLFPSELNLIITSFEEGRERLRHLFMEQGTHHISSLLRPPVV